MMCISWVVVICKIPILARALGLKQPIGQERATIGYIASKLCCLLLCVRKAFALACSRARLRAKRGCNVCQGSRVLISGGKNGKIDYIIFVYTLEAYISN